MPTSSPCSTEFGPVLEFLRQLWAVNHAIERTSKRMEQRLGITAQQRILLRLIGKYPQIAASQLAALLHVDAGTLSTALRRLEQRGLVARSPAPADRRISQLLLTDAGKKLDVFTDGTVESAVEQVLAQGSEAELQAVRLLLARLVMALEGTAGPDKEP